MRLQNSALVGVTSRNMTRTFLFEDELEAFQAEKGPLLSRAATVAFIMTPDRPAWQNRKPAKT